MRRRHSELIKIWADDIDLEVQYWGYGDSDVVHWCDINDPSWDEQLQYRFKPPELEVGQQCQIVTEDSYGRSTRITMQINEIDCKHAMVTGVSIGGYSSNHRVSMPFNQFKTKKVAIR